MSVSISYAKIPAQTFLYTTDAPGKMTDKEIAVCAGIGMGLFWAWTLLTGYNITLFLNAEHATFYAQESWQWNSYTQAITFLIISFGANRLQTLLFRRKTLVLALILACLSTLILVIAPSAFADANVFALTRTISAALTGFTGALIILTWAEYLSTFPSEISTAAMNTSLIVSALVFFLLTLLPDTAIAAFAVLLPLLSGSTLAICLKAGNVHITKHASTDMDAAPDALPYRSARIALPLLCMFFCALCGEVFRSFITISANNQGFTFMGNIYVYCGAIGAAILSVGLAFSYRKQATSHDAAIRLMLAILVAGYAITTIFRMPIYIGYAFFCSAFGALRCLSWMFSAYLCAHTKTSPLRVYGLSLSAFSLPVLVSAWFMNTFTLSIFEGSIPWEHVTVAIIGILFLFAIFMLNPQDVQTMWGLIKPVNASTTAHLPNTQNMPGAMTEKTVKALLANDAAKQLDRVFGEIKQAYNLTNREMDVLVLLYQGRSIPFIQQELYIAEGTATTHVRHIYQKLGVHTRQEFITCIQENCKLHGL